MAADPAPAVQEAASAFEPEADADAGEEYEEEGEDEYEDLDGDEVDDAREVSGEGDCIEDTQVLEDSNDEAPGEPSKDLRIHGPARCARPVATPQQALPMPPMAGACSYESLGSLSSLCGLVDAFHITTPSPGRSPEDSVQSESHMFVCFLGWISIWFPLTLNYAKPEGDLCACCGPGVP